LELGSIAESDKAGELWAVALSGDAKYLTATAYDGRVTLWQLEGRQKESWSKVREYETKGSFGLSVAIVRFIYLQTVQMLTVTRPMMARSRLRVMRMVVSMFLTTIVAACCIHFQVRQSEHEISSILRY